jgi:hypothetical protein
MILLDTIIIAYSSSSGITDPVVSPVSYSADSLDSPMSTIGSIISSSDNNSSSSDNNTTNSRLISNSSSDSSSEFSRFEEAERETENVVLPGEPFKTDNSVRIVVNRKMNKEQSLSITKNQRYFTQSFLYYKFRPVVLKISFINLFN